MSAENIYPEIVSSVSSSRIREMKTGDTVTFQVPTAKALLTAREQAYRVGRLDSRKFTTAIDYQQRRITITRIRRKK